MRAISVYGMVMGIAAVGGQLIGGVLIDANVAGLGWRAIFWVNVPSAWSPWRRRGDWSRIRAAHAGHLDLPGAALLAAGLVAIVLPLADGRQQGWLPGHGHAWRSARPCSRCSRATCAGFRSGSRPPLLDPAIFAVRTLRVGLTVQALFWRQQAASYLLLALFLSRAVAGSAGVRRRVRRPRRRVPADLAARACPDRPVGRRVIATGAVCGAIGDLLLVLAVGHWGVGGPLAALFPGLFLLGAGQGLCITPLTTTVLAHADARTAGSITGALSTAQQVGNAIGSR